MPIYEYQCGECGHQFDTLQKMSDEPLKDCPECMAPALTKLVSAPSFRLSGSGWYETDFKNDSDKKKNLTSSDKPADDSKKSEASNDKSGKTLGAESKAESTTASKKESSADKSEKSKSGKTEKNSSSSNAA